MTQDEIIEMAKQVGAGMLHGGEFALFGNEKLEAFAKLVAAKAIAELVSQETVPSIEDLEQEIYQNTRNFVSLNVMEWMLKRYYTHPPQRTEQEPVQEPKNYRHTWGKDGEGCVICGDKDWMNTSCKPLAQPAQRTEPIQSLQCFHCQVTIETLNDKVMQLLAERTEQNFCSRCGKRTADSTHIHTCTPPQD